MSLMGFHRRFGRPVRASAALLLTFLLSSCYGFQSGGGFPSDIRTIYIQPFDNGTPQFELTQEIFGKLTERLPRALGVRQAGEENADSWVRGKITRYEDVAQNYRAGNNQGSVEVLQHTVQVTIEIQLINRRNNTILWESPSLTGRGDYRPANQTDKQGRELAITNLIQQIIDGAQSQW